MPHPLHVMFIKKWSLEKCEVIHVFVSNKMPKDRMLLYYFYVSIL